MHIILSLKTKKFNCSLKFCVIMLFQSAQYIYEKREAKPDQPDPDPYL
jgi:hypothetical protein